MAFNPPHQINQRLWRTCVEQNSKRLGGVPVFRGTRVPVQSLFDHLSAGDSVNVFLSDFPGVTRKQIQTILSLAGEFFLARRK